MLPDLSTQDTFVPSVYMYERAVQCLKHSDSQVLIPMRIHVQM